MKNKILINILLNIISGIIPIIVLQLLAFPILAKEVGGEGYGVIISLVSALTIISFPLGNVLNNTRLLREEEYLKKNLQGDFNRILFFSILIGIISITILTKFIDTNSTLIEYFLLIFIVTLWIIKEYLVVEFQITLNYFNVMKANIFLALGYLLGIILFYIFDKWHFIYFLGFLFPVFYLGFKGSIWKERWGITKEFKATIQVNLNLYLSALLKNTVNYADKLLLLILLGPYSVAIYYSSAILGRIVSMIITPINSVILSYIVKNNEIEVSNIVKTIIVGVIFSLISYFGVLIVSEPFFNMFYPEWQTKALNIIKITTATAVITMLSSLINPYNLRYNNSKWQIILGGVYFIIYLVFSLILTPMFSLVGFSTAILAAAIINLMLQLVLLFSKMYKR